MQLSKLDNYTTRFWESFVSAFTIYDPEQSLFFLNDGFPQSMAMFYNFLHKLTDAMKGADRFVIVFDDFHMIAEPEIKKFIENLLSIGLKNLSIILISRSKIELNLQGFFAGNKIRRITQDELRFIPEEALGYFSMQDICLPDESFKNIYRITEGWISALYLVGLSLEKDALPIEQALSIAKRDIFMLIEQEVFFNYTREQQRLLIKCSLLEKIDIELIKKLSNGNLSIVSDIEKTNMFMHYEPTEKVYYFHQLFLEFLSSKQPYITEEEMQEAHFIIADWYHSQGLQIDALMHYRKCDRYEEIWDSISHFDIALPREVANLLLSLIEEFPARLAQKYPLILVVHARLLLNNGKIKDSEREFMQIIAQYEAMEASTENKVVIGEVYLFMAMISLLSFDYRFTEYYRKADACLPNGSMLIDSRLSFSDGNYMVLIKDPLPGEVARYVKAVTEFMPYGARAMHGAAFGIEYVTKAEAAYYTGDMKDAESSAYKAVYISDQKHQYDTMYAAYFVLVRVYLHAGNYAKATDCLAKSREKVENADPDYAHHVKNSIFTRDMMLGWYYSRCGEAEKIPDWILRKEKRKKTLSPNNFGRDQFIRAYCLLKSEKLHELFALMEALEIYYDEKGLLLARLEVQIYKAIAAHRLGDLQSSMAALKASYDLAHANSITMPFVELGKHMRALIYAAQRYAGISIPADWLGDVYAKSSTYAKQLNTIQARYMETLRLPSDDQYSLTKREGDILKLLCTGLTRKEIAGSLHISESTVKQSLARIYGKLNAENRVDAIRIAMLAGLDQ